MKKLVLITLLVVKSTISFAQTAQIEVSGVANFERKIEKYLAEVIISEDMSYNYNSSRCYADIKGDYFKKLAKAKIDTTKLKENKLEYLIKGYRKKGTSYSYETSSAEEYSKFLAILADGIQIYSKNVIYREVSDKEQVELKIKALKNAENQAKQLAKAIGKKLGNIIEVRDSNQYYTLQKRKDYYSSASTNEVSYSVGVKYQLQ